MKIRKVIWWLAVILLFFFATAFILYARQFGSMQFQWLNQFSISIDHNRAALEKIEIAGMDPPLFLKNLWIASSTAMDLATWSAVLFGMLTLLLFVTLLHEKRKNKINRGT